MTEKPTVAIRANSAEQKKKWQTAVEESEEYDSLSHLIRKAVERELSAESRETAQGGADGDRIGEVLTAIQRLEGDVSDVKDGLGGLEESVRAESVVSDEARTAAFRTLEASPMKAKTPEEVAQEAEIGQEEAAMALTHLRENMGGVTLRVTDDGEPAYYRTEG